MLSFHLPLRVAAAMLVFALALAACDPEPGPEAPGPEEVAELPAECATDSLGLPPLALSGTIPVSIPGNFGPTPVSARPNFDTFSWQSFIALNWPAANGQRGVANDPGDPGTFTSAANGSQVVWGTYKDANALFLPDGARPEAWTTNEAPPGVCPGVPAGQKVFLMASKAHSMLNDVNESFAYPLVDQDSNYVYFEIRFNQAQFDFIRGPDDDSAEWLYLARNLIDAEPVTMPMSTASPYSVGAMMLKASWRTMTPTDDASRYYVIDAQVYDPTTGACNPEQMGLVGLHIAQKLQDFPEWIWSTFEQVDNVPDAGVTGSPGYSFNNGTASPASPTGYANRPTYKSPNLVPKDQRTPVQVTRFTPIPDTPDCNTRVLNTAYQGLLAGTVWQNYQLVATQWPTDAATFVTMEDGGIYPADAGQPFPLSGVANTTMETYLQSPQDSPPPNGNSCMQCHYVAGKTDFSWSLQLRSQ